MKTFRLIGTGLMAVLLCFAFTACDGDDEEDAPNDPPQETEKKLVKMTQFIKGHYADYYNTFYFEYDSQEKLSQYRYISTTQWGEKTDIKDFLHSENSIMSTNKNGDYIRYNLFNDKINIIQREESIYSDVYHLKYDASGYLSNITEGRSTDYITEFNFTWSGNKLIKYQTESGREHKYTYNSKTCKGFNPIFFFHGMNIEDCLLLLAHPELAGFKSNQLPSYREWGWNDKNEIRGTWAFNYELYPDGYLKKCIVTLDGSDGIEGDTWDYYEYTFTWE